MSYIDDYIVSKEFLCINDISDLYYSREIFNSISASKKTVNIKLYANAFESYYDLMGKYPNKYHGFVSPVYNLVHHPEPIHIYNGISYCGKAIACNDGRRRRNVFLYNRRHYI